MKKSYAAASRNKQSARRNAYAFRSFKAGRSGALKRFNRQAARFNAMQYGRKR